MVRLPYFQSKFAVMMIQWKPWRNDFPHTRDWSSTDEKASRLIYELCSWLIVTRGHLKVSSYHRSRLHSQKLGEFKNICTNFTSIKGGFFCSILVYRISATTFPLFEPKRPRDREREWECVCVFGVYMFSKVPLYELSFLALTWGLWARTRFEKVVFYGFGSHLDEIVWEITVFLWETNVE